MVLVLNAVKYGQSSFLNLQKTHPIFYSASSFRLKQPTAAQISSFQRTYVEAHSMNCVYIREQLNYQNFIISKIES